MKQPLSRSHRGTPARSRAALGPMSGFTLIELMIVIAIVGLLSAFFVGLGSKPYNANPRNVSELLVEHMNTAKLRAVSSRHWHRVQVTGPSGSPANTIQILKWSEAGMKVPSGTCTSGVNCWLTVSTTEIASNVNVWDASTTLYTSTGTSVTQNASLDFSFDFRPDGSATGGTAFVADTAGVTKWRVLVRTATGSSYAREYW